MKYLMKHISVFAWAGFGLPLAAFAQSSPVTPPGDGSGVPVTIDRFYDLACEASNWIFAFVLIVGVIAILFGAVAFLTSRGDEDRVKDARRYVTYSLVGVSVAILARALIYVVGNFLGISDPGAELFAC